MKKRTSQGAVLHRLLLVTAAFCITIVSLAVTIGISQDTKIASEGSQNKSDLPGSILVFYNDMRYSHLKFLTSASDMNGNDMAVSEWQAVSALPGPAADGSNHLKLYDADSPILPHDIKATNVATPGTSAKLKNRHAYIDEEGSVWIWEENGEHSEEKIQPSVSQNTHITGLPPVHTLALGAGHVVALTLTGEVWAWALASGNSSSEAAPPKHPSKLEGLPQIKSIGAWREYGFACSQDGNIWIWQGLENKLEALTDKELAEAVSLLSPVRPVAIITTGATANLNLSAEKKSSSLMMMAGSSPSIPSDGLKLWLKADSGVDTNAQGLVTSWQDQSGNGNSGTQADPYYMPSTGMLPSGTVVRFRQPNGILLLPGFMYGSSEGEAFVVLSATSGSNSGLWEMGKWWGSAKYPSNLGVITDNFGSTSILSTQPLNADLSKLHLYNVSSKTGDWTSRLNGYVIYKYNYNSVEFQLYNTQIGGGNSGFSGDIAEILIYNKVLSESERAQVETYLVARHQLASSSPAAPSSLRVISGNKCAAVFWTASSADWTSYELERKEGNGSYVKILTTKELNTIDRALVSGKSYSYRVRAVTPNGSSAYSDEVSYVDPITVEPGFSTDGLRLWLQADALPLGEISRWHDMSGLGNDATKQGENYPGPVVIENENGRRSVKANSYKLNLPNFMSGATEGEVLILLKSSRISGYSSVWSMGASGAFYGDYSGNISESFGSNTAYSLGTPAFSLDEWNIYGIASKSNDWNAWINSTLQYQTQNNTVAFPANPTILGGYSAFAGEIGEVLVYDRVLTESERIAARRYLARKAFLSGICVPAAPELKATVISASQASLTWVDNPSPWIYYEVERKTGSSQFQKISETNGLGWIDNNVVSGNDYTYRIRGVNLQGNGAYSNQVTVAIDSDIETWPVDSIVMWLRADTLPSGPVASWPDISGRGLTASQPTASQRPTRSNNQDASIIFTPGQSQHLLLPAGLMSNANEGEVFIVLKSNATSGNTRGLWQWGNNSTSYYPASSGYLYDHFGNAYGTTISQPNTDITQWHFYNVTAGITEWTARFNGELAQKASSVTFRMGPYYRLGVGNPGNYFEGEIKELIVFSKVLTSAQRFAVSRYLSTQNSLPGISQVATPTSLNAKALSETQAILTWTDAAGSQGKSYLVERKANSGAFAHIATVGDVCVFQDEGLSQGNTYTYRVKARGLAGDSLYSNEAAASIIASGAKAPPETGLRLWLRAETLPAAAKLERWEDQSGNGHHASQPYANSQPSIVQNGANGLPSVMFVSANTNGKSLALPDVMSNEVAGDIFVVQKNNSSAYNSYFWDFGEPSYIEYYSGDYSDGFGKKQTMSLGKPIVNAQNWHIYQSSAGNGKWAVRFNGITQAEGSMNSDVTFSNTPYIGKFVRATGFFTGEIAEMIIYNRVLDDVERVNVTRYLATKYLKNSASLPADPTDVGVRLAAGAGNILSWSYTDADCSIDFVVERRVNTGSYQIIGYADSTTRSFVDEAVEPGMTYSYRIKARYAAGVSNYAESAPITITAHDFGVRWPMDALDLWLSADAGAVTDSAGRVLKWHDLSGRGHHAAHGYLSISAPPTLAMSEFSRPVIKFSAASRQMLSIRGLFKDTTEAEVFVALKTTGASGVSRGLWSTGIYNAGSSYPTGQGYISESFGTASAYFITITGHNQWHIHNVSAKERDWFCRRNGNAVFVSTDNNIQLDKDMHLGYGGSAYFDGDIAELIVFKKALTEAERAYITDYLAIRHSGNEYAIPTTSPTLSASPISSTEIKLFWRASNLKWVQYEIQRRKGAGSYQHVAETSNNYFIDHDLEPGTTYTYRMRQKTIGGICEWSPECSATTFGSSALSMPTDSLRLWLSAEDLPSGVRMPPIWPDRSDRKVLVSTTHSSPPMISVDTQGRQSALLSGSPSFTAENVMAGATEGEIFALLKSRVKTGSSSSNHYGLWKFGGTSTSFGSYYPYGNGTIGDDFGNEATRTMSAPSDITQWHLYNVSSRNGEWIARINGVEHYKTTSNTATFPQTMQIGTATSSRYFYGDVAELIVFDRVLTAAERQAVGRRLAGTHSFAPVSIPTAPSGLHATTVPNRCAVELNWIGSSNPAFGLEYVIERKCNGGMWEVISVLSTDHYSMTDTATEPGLAYYYRIKSRNWAGESAYSEAQITLPPGGGPEITMNGMRLWLRASTGVAKDSTGKISRWEDQSGKGNHLVQTSLANQPILTCSADGGMSVKFSPATYNYLNLPTAVMAGASSGDVFVVLKTTAKSGVSRSLWNWGQSSVYYPSSSGSISESFGSNTVYTFGVGNADITQWHLYNISAQTGEWRALLNGKELHKSVSNTFAVGLTLRLGVGGSYYFDGEIAEVIVYDRVLDESERMQIGRSMASRYEMPEVLAVETLALPYDVTATPYTEGKIAVAWKAGNTQAGVSFILERRDAQGGQYAVLDAVGDGSRIYIDTSVLPGHTYFYRLKAISWTRESAYSNEANATALSTGSSDVPISGLALWLRADLGVYDTETGNVNVWSDLSGNNRHANQTTTAVCPTLVWDNQVGYAIKFSATSSQKLMLRSTNEVSEAFVVLKATAGSGTDRGLWYAGGGNYYPKSNGELHEYAGSNVVRNLGMPKTDITKWHVYNITAGGSMWTARLNGIEQFKTTLNTKSTTGFTQLGYGGYSYFDGEISEVLVYNRKLSNAERAQIENYVSARTGIQIDNPSSLFATHGAGSPVIDSLGTSTTSTQGRTTSAGYGGLLLLDPNAGADYAFSTADAGLGRYSIDLTAFNRPGLSGTSLIDIWVDDTFVRRHYLGGKEGSQDTLEGIFRVSQGGSHVLRIRQHSPSTFLSTRIDKVRVYAIALNVSDASTQTYMRQFGLDKTGTIQSKVAPYCMEGSHSFIDDAELRIANELMPVSPQLERRWYADIPLAPNTNVPVTAKFAQGLLTQTATVQWIPTNTILEPAAMNVRLGDQLLLTGHPGETADTGSLKLAITPPGKSVETITTTANLPVAYTFDVAGRYQVAATHTAQGGTVTAKTLDVQVRSVDFGGDPFVAISGAGAASRLIKVGNGPVILERDSDITVSATSISGNATVNITPDNSVTRYVVARPVTGGSILGTLKINVPMTLQRPSDQSALHCVFTFPTGEKIVKITFFADDFPEGYYLVINLFGGGVTSLNGTRRTTFYRSDFSPGGQLDVYFIAPSTAASICQAFTLYDPTGKAVNSW